MRLLRDSNLIDRCQRSVAALDLRVSSSTSPIVGAGRQRYLAEIAEVVRRYRQHVLDQSHIARTRQQLKVTHDLLEEAGKPVEDVACLISQYDSRLDAISRATERLA